jgi:urease accessory protein
MMIWRLLQLADGGFPAGGFAHSGGLEAAVALGHVRGEGAVADFARAALWQAGTFALPLVGAAADAGAGADAAALARLDERCDVAQGGHVSRRASRAQGRAWLRTCGEVFPAVVMPALPLGHLPVAFGAAGAALEVTRDELIALYLHVTARGALSAAVRLGALGPHAAQRVHDRLGGEAAAVVAACGTRTVDEAAHSAPLHELFGNQHDALPARLFQS